MKKFNKIFLKIFIPILIIEIVLVVGFTTYIFSDIYTSVEDSLLTDKRNYINGVKNNFDQQIQTIEHAFSAYSLTNSFEDDMNKPLNYRDYLHIRAVNTELNYISLMGSEQAEYSLISLSNKWKINGNTFSEMSEDNMREIESAIEGRKNSVFWEATEEGVRMIMQLPLLSKQKIAVGIAELDNYMLKKLTQNNQMNSIFIFNKDMDYLYSSDKEILISEEELQLLTSENKESLVLPNGDVLLSAKSSNSQWLFTTVLKYSDVADKVSNSRNGILLITTLLIFLLGSVTFGLARRFIKPFKVIGNKLSITENDMDSVDKIVAEIDNLLVEQIDLSAILLQQKEQLQTLFIWNLFRNNLSDSEIKQNLTEFSYNWVLDKKICVFLIQLDGKNDTKQKAIQLFALKNIIEEIDFGTKIMTPILYNNDTVGVVATFDKEILPEEREILINRSWEKFQQYLNRLSISAYIGISSEFCHLSDTSVACQQAKEALRYQYYSNHSIFFYDNKLNNDISNPISKYPMAVENQMFENIRKGMIDSVPDLYNQLFQEIFKNNITPINLKVSISTLLNHLLEFNQLMGLNNSMFTNSQKYEELLSIENIDEIKIIIYDQLVSPLFEKEHYERKSKNLSDKMKKIVHTQYDQVLSLEIIGDQLNYSTVYLSIIFKEECGENFNDYLQNYRLEIAKKWLKETTYTVKEISERLQYTNSQNFIRFFKRKLGMTPGEYRKKSI